MICPDCQTELDGSPKFCPKCGSRVTTPTELISSIKYCPQCGTENLLSAKFCKNDAYPFEGDATAVPNASKRISGRADNCAVPTEMQIDTAVVQGQSPQASTGMVRSDPPIATYPTRANSERGTSKNYATGLLFGVPTVLAVIAASMGGYKYWSERKEGHKASSANVSSTQSQSEPPVRPETRLAIADAGPPNSTPRTVAPNVDVAKIKTELNQQLQRAGFGSIDVTVNADGSVNLEGAVPTKRARGEAVRIALSQYGVERVDETGLQIISTDRTVSSTPHSPNVVQHRPPSYPSTPPVWIPDPSRLQRDVNRLLRGG